jgi:hypothetical protein
MPDGTVRDRIALLVLASAVLLVGARSFDRAYHFEFDFHHFYLDARYVWEHGRLNPDLTDADPHKRRQLPFYPPVVPLALAPFTAGGPVAAALLWSLAQSAALAGVLAFLRRHVASIRVLAAAVVLTAPAIWEAAKFNQLSFFVLLLVLLGAAGTERGRGTSGGVWFAAAAVLKVLPAVFSVWMLLKRRWSAVVVFVTAAPLIASLPCLFVFGLDRTIEYHREWLEYNLRFGADSSMRSIEFGGRAAAGEPDVGRRTPPEHFFDHRNQSIGAVVARLLGAERRNADGWRPFRLDELACRWVSGAVAVFLLLGLAWSTRRPSRSIPPGQRWIEVCVYALAMFVFSPLARQYYLVWALPAVSVAVAALGETAPGVRRRAAVAVLVWLLGLAGWTADTARSLGVSLITMIALGAIVLTLRPARTGAAAAARPADSAGSA